MSAAEELRKQMESWPVGRLYDTLATNPQQYTQWAASSELRRRQAIEEEEMRQAQIFGFSDISFAAKAMVSNSERQADALQKAADASERNSGETARIAQRTLTVLMWTLVATALAAIGQIASVVVSLLHSH